ncbi:G-protein coupled receptor family C group 6 member A-like [Rhinophrynus dorsalis]
MIGGIFPIHKGVSNLLERTNAEDFKCTRLQLHVLIDALSMIYSIEKINNSTLLPGITLGYEIYDSCSDALKAIKATLHLIPDSFTKNNSTYCNSTINIPAIKAVVGEKYSEISIAVSRILSLHLIPQISPASSAATLSDKVRFPSFLRTIPNDNHQTQAIAKLIRVLQWNWVGIITNDDDYGRSALDSLNIYFKEEGICTAFSKIIPSYVEHPNMTFAINDTTNELVAERSPEVVVVFLKGPIVSQLFEKVIGMNISKTWIASDSWSYSKEVSSIVNIQNVGTIFGLNFKAGNVQGFAEYLQNLQPPGDGGINTFLEEYKELRFGCTEEYLMCMNSSSKDCLHIDSLQHKSPQTCKVENVSYANDNYLLKNIEWNKAYSTSLAVTAIAQALKNILCTKDKCVDYLNLSPHKTKQVSKQALQGGLKVLYGDGFWEIFNPYVASASTVIQVLKLKGESGYGLLLLRQSFFSGGGSLLHCDSCPSRLASPAEVLSSLVSNRRSRLDTRKQYKDPVDTGTLVKVHRVSGNPEEHSHSEEEKELKASRHRKRKKHRTGNTAEGETSAGEASPDGQETQRRREPPPERQAETGHKNTGDKPVERENAHQPGTLATVTPALSNARLLNELKKGNYSYNNETFHFDPSGDVLTGYDIISWNPSNKKETEFQIVGKYDMSDGIINLNRSLLFWNNPNNQVPFSNCSKPCIPGYYKKHSDISCCYKCIPCAEQYYTPEADMNECLKCPNTQWSNNGSFQCLNRTLEYFQWNDPFAIALMSFTALGFLLVIVIGILFIKYSDTPTVKAAGGNYTYLLVVSLLLNLVSIWFFIGQPKDLICQVRQPLYGISFTVSVLCILIKAIRILLAFESAKRNKAIITLTYQPVAIIITLTCVQLCICIFWFIFKRPFVKEIDTLPKLLILQCDEGSYVAFSIMLGYIGFLAFICFILAYKGRKLPEKYNEARCITFSMLIYIFVWIIFIPIYMNASSLYLAAVQAVAILASIYGVISCHLIPACYIITFKRKSNNRDRYLQSVCAFYKGKRRVLSLYQNKYSIKSPRTDSITGTEVTVSTEQKPTFLGTTFIMSMQAEFSILLLILLLDLRITENNGVTFHL